MRHRLGRHFNFRFLKQRSSKLWWLWHCIDEIYDHYTLVIMIMFWPSSQRWSEPWKVPRNTVQTTTPPIDSTLWNWQIAKYDELSWIIICNLYSKLLFWNALLFLLLFCCLWSGYFDKTFRIESLILCLRQADHITPKSDNGPEIKIQFQVSGDFKTHQRCWDGGRGIDKTLWWGLLPQCKIILRF